MAKQIRQFGTWSSPLSSHDMASRLRLRDVRWDDATDTLVWTEGRGKLGVLVAQSGIDAPRELNGSELSVAGRVGYGGGDFHTAHGRVIFAGADGRLYRVALDSGPARPVTPAFGQVAAPVQSVDGQWIAFVHTYEGRDVLALVDAGGDIWPRKLFEGTDFVTQPAWHPHGTHLALVVWNHPRMPWDGSELHLLALARDHQDVPYVESQTVIAGDEHTAVFQPEFSPDGRYLAYASDASGWWHLYLHDIAAQTHVRISDKPAEHGLANWIQGMRMFGWASDSRGIYFLRNTRGFYTLHYYEIETGVESLCEGLRNYTAMEQIAVSKRGSIAMIASSSTMPPRVISVDPAGGMPRVHRRSERERIPQEQLSTAQPVEWNGRDGEKVYGLYYAPVHPRFEGEGAPPLIVHIHGGPTSQKTAGYNSEAQFFATRGYAVLEVNHRGSTGYGRDYMLRLRGNWGVYDVEDSASGAQYLVDEGLADERRLVIYGRSAGGYTVLQSLVNKPGLYRAGVCCYGVSNLFTLAQDTHKFEERYLDSLLGPLPEAADIYRARSPLFRADQIVDPLILFQGEEDQVVPRSQSDSIAASLRARGVPHEYHVYEGEGHGFRQPETLNHFYSSMLKFLTQYVIYG